MARSAAISIENNFTKGLVTEVTGVNSPENSVTETLNVIYDNKGKAYTRKGFDLEAGHVTNDADATGNKNEFLWETVGKSTGKSFVCVQLGTKVRFFSVDSSSSLSAGFKTFYVDLSNHKVSNFSSSQVANNNASFSSGKGYLFIAHPCCETLYVQYDPDNDSITIREIHIKTRDFEGLDDGLDVRVRPTTLSKNHKYNIFNQSWDNEVLILLNNPAATPWEAFHDETGKYPSNADVLWDYFGVSINSGNEGVQPDRFNSATRGTTPASKGHYIVDTFNVDRSGVSGVSGIPKVTSKGYRPSAVAFYAGRVFYAGVSAPDFASSVYFSQIIESNDQFGKCYQSNDPTSKDAFDLISSDGGTLKIQDMTTVVHMLVIGPSLFIFATNGIWSLTGSNDSGFKATDYVVTKVSSFPALSKSSIVDVGGLPVWWNYEGIFTIQKNDVGIPKVTNLTNSTIQSFYNQIPQGSKELAKGYFNDQELIVYWLYSTNDSGNFNYTNILVFDVTTQAFYVLDIPKDAPYTVFGLIAVRTSNPVFTQDNVTDSSNNDVTDQNSIQVYTLLESDSSKNEKVFKFFMRIGNTIYISELRNENYLDYGQFDYQKYFVTGYRIRGDLIKLFQTEYLTVIMENQVNSSCYIQGLWDYANSPNTGRYTNPQQAYKERNLRSYQRSKLLIRGNGYSLQFKFSGEIGKPFAVVGWVGYETSTQVP